ncbi:MULTISPECIES: hypothetical protein [unclassified Sphingosinithalassobacter]|uniref:hypothetical protein n=1 Tax=unclassified Sphingosinithalassobacter TaxID=2676235 RepID=UPI00165E797E|nr:hypothetical protein [Sphingosinithalassobacter sp. CS137]
MRRFALLLLPAALAACGGDEAAPGGVSAEEAQALNEAAEALDLNGATVSEAPQPAEAE